MTLLETLRPGVMRSQLPAQRPPNSTKGFERPIYVFRKDGDRLSPTMSQTDALVLESLATMKQNGAAPLPSAL